MKLWTKFYTALFHWLSTCKHCWKISGEYDVLCEYGLVLCVNLTGLLGAQTFCSILFCVCLWGRFSVRLTFELADWAKRTSLPDISRPYRAGWRPAWSWKVMSLRVGGNLSCPSAFKLEHWFFLPLNLNWNGDSSWVLSLPAFRLEPYSVRSWFLRPLDWLEPHHWLSSLLTSGMGTC